MKRQSKQEEVRRQRRNLKRMAEGMKSKGVRPDSYTENTRMAKAFKGLKIYERE